MTQHRNSLIVSGAGSLALMRETLPDVGLNDAVVRVSFGGICGSDLHYWKSGSSGTAVLRAPLVLGHEIVGVVAAAALDGSGPISGTPVAVYPATPCENCSQCRANRPNLCVQMRYLGSAAHFPHTGGGFASEIVVRANNLRALPASMPLERFAMTEPASVAWHAATRADKIAGARVLVVGAGPIGLALVAVLRLFAPARITVVDLYERPLTVARSLGADVTISAGNAQLIDAETVDVTFECSGSAAGMEQAVTTTRGGGEIILVGNQKSRLVPFAAAAAISSELTVRGSYRFDQEFDEVIAAIATGYLDLSTIVTASFDVSEFQTAFELAANPEKSSKVLLSFPGH